MPRHDEELLKARAFAVQCYYSNSRNMAAAIRRFESEWNREHDECKIADVRKFIQYWVNSLETRFSLLDAGGQGRHKLAG